MSSETPPAETTRADDARSPASGDPSHDVALTVLIAEDDPTLQQLSSQILDRLGHRATVVSNGEEAVSAVVSGAYDVVLMDMNMPEMGGAEAARRIRAAGDTVVQPYIIALTGAAREQDREECFRAGMDGYVTKPFRLKNVRDALEMAQRETPPSPAGSPSGGFSSLDELGPEVKADVLRTFLMSSGEDVAAIEDAVRRGSADDARATAHRLRGSSLAVGATLLADACARIEHGSDEQALDPRRTAAVRDAAALVAADAERELRAPAG